MQRVFSGVRGEDDGCKTETGGHGGEREPRAMTAPRGDGHRGHEWQPR